jgi:molecular chaperone GrpE
MAKHDDEHNEAHVSEEGPVTEADPDETAALIDDLQAQLAAADSRYKRALADYQNFQRRSVENERRAREDGMARVVESLIPVLDNFRLALQQDPGETTAEQLFGGVRVILDELTKSLGAYGVAPIEPAPGDEFDPMQHEAMMRAPSDDVAEGAVVMLLQAGYALGQRVVRPAKVSVSSGPADGGASDADV